MSEFSNFIAKVAELADDFLKEAKKLTYKKRKSLPKTSFIFPKEHPDVTDGKDHFPIDTRNRGQNAKARANQYGKAGKPKWYKGKSESFHNAVERAVNGRYPGLSNSDKD